MNTSNHLLHLVTSMTKQEKRYFKLYASFYNKDKGNVCLQLFEIIDKERPQHEQDLHQAVKKKPYKHRIAALKNQLTELLLDSLASFHASKQSSFQIRRLLTHAEILRNKGLYEHSKKLIARAEKKVRDTQHSEFLVEIASRKRAILIRQVPDAFETHIDHLYQQAEADLSMILHTNHYLKLMDVMQVLATRYAASPVPEDREKLRTIAADPLLQNISPTSSFDAQLARYNTLGTYCILTGNISQAYEHYRHAVQLWKSSPVLIAERSSQYRRYLLNYLNCLLDSPNEKEFTAVINDIKTLPSSFSEPENTTRATIWNIELLYHLNHGHLKKGALVIAEVEQNLSRYARNFSRVALMTLHYNCTVFYFLSGNYRRTLDYINLLLNERHGELKRDLQEFAHVLGIVAHYELCNVDILDNMIRSTKRLLKQRETQRVLEYIVLKAIQSLLSCVDKDSTRRIFRALYADLVALLHQTPAQELPGLPELLFWTKSKLLQESIHEVFTTTMQTARGQSYHEMFPPDITSATQRHKKRL